MVQVQPNLINDDRNQKVQEEAESWLEENIKGTSGLENVLNPLKVEITNMASIKTETELQDRYSYSRPNIEVKNEW